MDLWNTTFYHSTIFQLLSLWSASSNCEICVAFVWLLLNFTQIWSYIYMQGFKDIVNLIISTMDQWEHIQIWTCFLLSSVKNLPPKVVRNTREPDNRRQILIQKLWYLWRTAIRVFMETGSYRQSAERKTRLRITKGLSHNRGLQYFYIWKFCQEV